MSGYGGGRLLTESGDHDCDCVQKRGSAVAARRPASAQAQEGVGVDGGAGLGLGTCGG